MSDLVERLRNCGSDRDPFKTYAVCDEAAARIEALEAALRDVAATQQDPYLDAQHDAQLEGLAIGLEQRGEKSAAHIIRLALKRLHGVAQAPTNRALHDAIAAVLQRQGLTYSGIQEAVREIQKLYASPVSSTQAPAQTPCPSCNGNGVSANQPEGCTDCLGTGVDHYDTPAQAPLAATRIEVLETALRELADLMDDVINGDYKPDSFTTQPARAALASEQDK